MEKLKIPVLFLIFNRPDTTKRVFERIRQVKPQQLFIVADGSRPEKPNEKALCEETRQAVNLVDWECELHKLFRDENMGCKNGVSSAIDWFFDHVEKGIILEDDCVPDPSFFLFCDKLLEFYKDDDRIGMISGNNFGFDLYDKSLSYSFSKHGKIWGWATWKRCWQKFDLKMGFLDQKTTDIIKSNISSNPYFVEKWWEGVDAVLQRKSDSWAYPWAVTRYANNWLTIRPKTNLVAHIGFGENATHTKGQGADVYKIVSPISFPLVHPKIVVPDIVADRQLEKFSYPKRTKPSLLKRAIRKVRSILIQDRSSK